MRYLSFILAGVLCALTLPVRAEAKPAPLFGDGTVLQREAPAPVRGTADKGEKATVSFPGQRVSSVADAPADRVTIQQRGGTVTIENSRVSVSYDLSKGTFSATDKRSGKAVIADAHARIGDWPANAADSRHEWKARTVRDELGKGKTLTIRSSREGQPLLLLEITLYQEQGFAVLAGGLENTLDREIQLKEFHPLEGGEILPDVAAGGPAITDAKTLNAPSGARDTRVTAGPFRLSPNNLMLTFTDAGARRTIVAGGLTYHEFLKSVRTSPAADLAMQAAGAGGPDKGERVFLDLRAADPVGKRVDPGHSYLPDDRFYVDFTTPDPFEALEQYGRQVRSAQKARPNPYDFPTVCSWYAGVWNTKGAQDHPEKSKYGIATTKGQVEEMDYIKSIGFLNYSRVALRLVPDNYTDNNMNGWWDDAHYQKEGFFVPPYETARKWGRAVRERGGLPGIYIQPTNYKGRGISLDFRLAFPHLMLGKSSDRMMDYTNPESQAHMRKVYANLRSGGVATIMFDYCDEMLSWDEAAPWEKAWGGEFGRGGLEDKYATASSSYRTMLRLAKEGLGPESWVHERALGNPGSDVALGISDSQRTEGDTYGIDPALIARSGLRWYKNRVVIAYDMDAKDLLAGWKHEGFQGTEEDGRRMLLTMSYVTASRLLLGNSFRDLPPQAIRDLQRVVPYHTAPRSARPIDAFIAAGWPRAYDFAVDPNWRQLTLLNDTTSTLEMAVPLSGDTVAGALGLNADSAYYTYDFWNDHFEGRVRGADSLRQSLRPGEARMLSLHRVEANPQFLSTNRHLMQGYVDMPVRPKWDGRKMTLSGTSNVVGGETYKVVIACNGFHAASASATGAAAKVEALPGNDGLVVLSLDSSRNAAARWGVAFTGTAYAGGYDYFRNIQYPPQRRADVGLDKIEQEGGPDAVGYNKRVVNWWPKKGVDVVDPPEGVELRTWTIRTPELEPLVALGVFAKWWPEDLRGRKQFKGHLIGFRGIGSAQDNPFFDKARIRALGNGICPGVVLRLEDGRKRCFTRGSFSEEDQAYIVALYEKEMARVRKTLEPPPGKIPPDIASRYPVGELYTPGTFRVESDRFVISSGSEEPDDGIPGVWINKSRENDAAAHRTATLRMFEDYWAYNEYAGHLMPFWEKPVRYKYSVVYGGTKVNGLELIGRGNGGGYGGCGTACWEGLYHEWGHGFGSDPMVLLGGGETRCDALQTMADPSLVRKVSFQIQRPYKNLFWGQYPGGFGYTMLGDDPNWGSAAVASFPCLMSDIENTPMHVIARLGQERGIWDNGIKGMGDFMGEIGARYAEYDYELEGMLRETYPTPNRACLVALDRAKGLYRSTRTEAPEPFGINVVRLAAEPGAEKITVDFRGIYDPDTYGDWRACIVAYGANGRPRYTPLWNKGEMAMETKEGDKRYWLTVTATPYALVSGQVDGGGKVNHVYQGGFTYKYPYEVQLTGCRPANPNAAIGVNENMKLIGPTLMARADANLENCGQGDWPHPSDTPEYQDMKRTLEALAAKAPAMIERFRQQDLFTDSVFCPVANAGSLRIRAVGSAVFLEWRAKWLLENAQGARHPNGGGWVARSAKAAPAAYVGPECMVLDGAQVLDSAIIEDYAMVSGPKVVVKDHARVYGKAVVCGDVTLAGYARVSRTIFNRASKMEWNKQDPNAPPYKFQMVTGVPVKRDGPEERVEVFKDAGFKLQANYAFDRPETVLLEDWYQEHSLGAFAFGAHSADLIFYDGVLYGKPGFAKDGDVRAFTFNGKDQYAEADGAVADLGTTTIDVSFKWDGGEEQTLFDFGSSTENRFMLVLASSGEPALVVVRGGKLEKIAGAKPVPAGKWAACRVEMDGRRIRLWLNNEKVAEKSSTFRASEVFPAGAEKRNFIAATRDQKEFFKGAIDYLRIYFTVYDDFSKAPEPPMVSSRRIDPDFMEGFDKRFAGYEAREAKYRDEVRKTDIYRFYEQWNKKVDDRIAELGFSEEAGKMEQEAKNLEARLETRRNELSSEFDRQPESADKRRKFEEIEKKRQERFRELQEANGEFVAARREEEEARKLKGEIEQSARTKLEADQDPRYGQASARERKAREKMGEIERGIWSDATLAALESERESFNTYGAREAFINKGVAEMFLRINQLKAKIKALRVETALAQSPDEYQALVSIGWGKDQYRNAIEERMKGKILPLMPEDKTQMRQAAPFQMGKWSTRVDWDGRTPWEKSGGELSPIMKRWLKRMKPYLYQ